MALSSHFNLKKDSIQGIQNAKYKYLTSANMCALQFEYYEPLVLNNWIKTYVVVTKSSSLCIFLTLCLFMLFYLLNSLFPNSSTIYLLPACSTWRVTFSLLSFKTISCLSPLMNYVLIFSVASYPRLCCCPCHTVSSPLCLLSVFSMEM